VERNGCKLIIGNTPVPVEPE